MKIKKNKNKMFAIIMSLSLILGNVSGVMAQEPEGDNLRAKVSEDRNVKKSFVLELNPTIRTSTGELVSDSDLQWRL